MPCTREYLSELIERYLERLELPARPDGLYAPIRYSLEGSGKRIRPLVALMACEAFGGDPREALPLAAAVEIFHNFTLLHDDIMDNAPMRRGKDAVHTRWGVNTAILSGDAMVIFAYKQLALSGAAHIAELLDEFNLMGAEVCEGQQYDMDFEELETVSEEQYIEMIALKTGALIARSAKMGAIAGGAGSGDCQKIYRFGSELGLAFQLQDDLLDSYGDHVSFGKKVGGDIIEGKKSFLAVTAMRTASPGQCAVLKSLLSDRTLPDAEKVARVRDVYNDLDIKNITRQRIAFHISRAAQALDGVDAAGEKLAPLRELALSTLNREK